MTLLTRSMGTHYLSQMTMKRVNKCNSPSLLELLNGHPGPVFTASQSDNPKTAPIKPTGGLKRRGTTPPMANSSWTMAISCGQDCSLLVLKMAALQHKAVYGQLPAAIPFKKKKREIREIHNSSFWPEAFFVVKLMHSCPKWWFL